MKGFPGERDRRTAALYRGTHRHASVPVSYHHAAHRLAHLNDEWEAAPQARPVWPADLHPQVVRRGRRQGHIDAAHDFTRPGYRDACTLQVRTCRNSSLSKLSSANIT